MDNDMTAKRADRLTPAGRLVLAEIQEAMVANDLQAIPSLIERISDLPPSDQGEIVKLVDLSRHGTAVEASRLDDAAAAAQDLEQVILTAEEKLRAEGKPITPNMTVRQAYEVLQG